MTTAKRSRWALGGATGVLWTLTIGTAMGGISFRLYLAVCLATLIVSLWTLAAWLTRGDHATLAHVRMQIEIARLKTALAEEADLEAEDARIERRIRSVA